MIKSCIAALGALTVLSAPAFADYDIVRVGPLHFGTREETEGQVRAVCRDNGSYRGETRRGEIREEYREERR